MFLVASTRTTERLVAKLLIKIKCILYDSFKGDNNDKDEGIFKKKIKLEKLSRLFYSASAVHLRGLHLLIVGLALILTGDFCL